MKLIDSKFQWNGTLKLGNKPNKIILHHAEASSCTVYDIHNWHIKNGWTGIGYHYFIRKDGNIYKGRPENAIGAHCINNNSSSISICVEGRYQLETMPQVQYDSLIELIKDIDIRYGKMPIFGHGELNNTNCPGKNFPLEKIKNNRHEEAGDFMSKIYKNGSTIEPVYQTTECVEQVGLLDPYEECECIGIIKDKAIVLYTIRGGAKKVGFVKWTDGIKK